MSTLSARARFLFRNEAGTIDAATWRRHAGWLAAVVVVLTTAWLLLRPYTHHDLATSAFLAPMTILAFTYLIVFAFAVLLDAVSFTMLSMKRLRDRDEWTGLAGLLPLSALFSGALHFIQPQAPDVISIWYLVAGDVATAAVLIWTVVDLGFGRSRAASAIVAPPPIGTF